MTQNKATPIIKWVGGKKRLIPALEKFVPKVYDTYYEPFLGGAAMFFHLNPEKAVLNDYNNELVNLYSVVKNNVESLVSELKSGFYQNTPDRFAEIRQWDREPGYIMLPDVKRAARFLYLNRTSFNGLYRVNSKNQFNVPYGKYLNPPILNEELLLAAHEPLNKPGVSIENKKFEDVLNRISSPNNFIYLDPPYVPLNADSFVGYTDTSFSMSQHQAVAELAAEQDAKGNFVLVSNSDSPLIPDLYPGFTVHKADIHRGVGAKKETRGKIQETILVGKTLTQMLATQ